ncbi:DUF1919 domain-containing protein [Prevotella sp. HMSC073D09]|uniref:DUF1919 domain-containing protein n=1 Tax=Prevotella sp. HMSC073D09 TaxID=1739459 RepID=UPI0021107FF5|nr:DUF1919 domain-containing protein [Prevotella sp. HMSC073D09]
MRLPREMYHIRKSRMNKNNSPTIICNNCVGGVILHDLGLRFNTPTINTLFLSFDDFLYFVEHLKEFSELDVYELKQTEYPFPVGIQEHEGRVVRVGFVHYASFDEGKAAWIKRMKRVNLDNTFVVYESQMISDEELDAFSSIKYPKMVLSLTDKSRERKYSYYKGHQLYKNWFPGKILVYKGFFRTKRYLDDFDYISFLNNGI